MNTSTASTTQPPSGASRPSALSDPSSVSSLQNRFKQHTEAAAAVQQQQQQQQQQQNTSSSIPIYELHQSNSSNAADGTSTAAAGGGNQSLMYSGFTHRANSPSIVGTANQSRSLRDRIYERTGGYHPPYTAAAQQQQAGAGGRSPVPVGGISVHKDIYAYEQPFPVNTVFEVQRINNPIPEGERPQSIAQPLVKQSDTLLTDVESASLIKTLERKLVESQESLDSKNAELAAKDARVKELEGEMDGHKETAEQATARLTEAQAQCEAARQSIVAAVDVERGKLNAEWEAKAEQAKQQADAEIAGLNDELQRTRSSISLKDDDQSSLFSLVADLQKAVRDGADQKRKDAELISRLDRELQESRTRAATVSTGFHAKEKQVRDSLSQVEMLQKEVSSLIGCRQELNQVQETLSTTRHQYDQVMTELRPLRGAAEERDRLQGQCNSLEQEVSQKNEELSRLRGQVDVVRQQADSVYARSSNFRSTVNDASQRAQQGVPDFNNNSNASAAAGNNTQHSYASLPVGGGTPLPGPNNSTSAASQGQHSDALSSLKADILAEDARVDAERGKWKSGNN